MEVLFQNVVLVLTLVLLVPLCALCVKELWDRLVRKH